MGRTRRQLARSAEGGSRVDPGWMVFGKTPTIRWAFCLALSPTLARAHTPRPFLTEARKRVEGRLGWALANEQEAMSGTRRLKTASTKGTKPTFVGSIQAKRVGGGRLRALVDAISIARHKSGKASTDCGRQQWLDV